MSNQSPDSGEHDSVDWADLTPAEPVEREVGLFVGRLVRAEFLEGVAGICSEQGVEWEWDLRREWLMRKVLLTLRGPVDRVTRAEGDIRAWAARFHDASGGSGIGI
jgi:hypothetical protein